MNNNNNNLRDPNNNQEENDDDEIHNHNNNNNEEPVAAAIAHQVLNAAGVNALQPLGPSDQSRMTLSTQEREWAMAIKQAIESNPEVDNESDFFYAAMALVEQGNVEAAVRRTHNLQEIRQEYDIVDSFERGRRALHQSFQLYPEHFLSFSYSYQYGSYVLVVDFAKQPTVQLFHSHIEGMKPKLREIYYMNQIVSPDFESIRKGAILVAECGRVDLVTGTKNMTLFRHIWHIILAFPSKMQKVKHFHTGLFSNLLVSATKKFLPEEMCSSLEVGCICEAGSLDRLYLQPNLEAANQRVLCRLEETLLRRYENEAKFKL
ncbi:expressed unknown protein [Seminavis robusta]|uniref:CRAL-TRIO domain-containing protein n=1 Tax=Seminavis robusta TaxID=568900 RepID=A0A9N8DJJ6_9STRA|nr:expressed unknown protein [Seminavis robusta]|eukprot:Sro178_g078110.1 n/a (319) ;mRNA; f:32448-33404